MKRPLRVVVGLGGLSIALLLGLQSLGADQAGMRTSPTAEEIRAATGQIDDERLKHPQPGEWITYNGSLNEQRYSPLDQINDTNVTGLKLVWSFSTNSTRGLEATPLVVGGVMYTTAPWSVVYAIDARTGKQIWSYDPKVPKEWDKRPAATS